ncbi:MAG: hypothetical protein ABID64_05405 [Nitrospirota bacterium]
MTTNKDRALKYGTTVYAALVFLFFVVGYFIYSYFTNQPVDIEDYVIEVNEDGIMEVSPGENSGPDYLPDVEPPTSPPPGN